MIRVLFFDLGGTLIDSNRQLFPGVKQALSAIGGLRTADNKPLLSCLVSDFDMVTPPITSAKTKPVFERYLAILDQADDLRTFFEPVQRRITLSTHAGVMKPAQGIFRKALERLRSKAKLSECLLVTENVEHVNSVQQQFDMQSLHFGTEGPQQRGFSDWTDAPGLIARLVGSTGSANVRSLLQSTLAERGIEVLSAESNAPRLVYVSGTMWHPISVPGHADLKDLLVAIPVHGTVHLGAKGEVESTDIEKPSAEQIDEAKSYVASLAEHGQIAGRSGGPAIRATHKIETDTRGLRKLVRKGFSAV